MELDLDHIERIAKQRQEAGGRLAARPEVILAMAARIRALESASQPGSGEAEDIIERFRNPMTPYGLLVRALRIVAGTTLMDMANHLSTSPSRLSGIEHGRKPVTHEDVVAASGYFHGTGIPGTLIVLERAFSVSSNATIAAPSAGNGEAKGGRDDEA